MKKFFIIAICVIIIILLCVYGTKDKKTENIENSTTENVAENILENVADENNTKENTVTEKIENTSSEYSITNNIYDQNTGVGTTDNKQKAIDLVKNTWGEDSTVSFRCDSVTNDGIYIIAVVSKETMSVKNYFRVNLETGDVEVDY